MKKLVCCLVLLGLISCSKDEPAPVVNPYVYLLSEKGCSTQRQEFKNLEEMCLGLQNEKLNSFCAFEQRKNFFAKTCPEKVFTPDWGVGEKEQAPTIEVSQLQGDAVENPSSKAAVTNAVTNTVTNKVQLAPKGPAPEFAKIQSACAGPQILQEVQQAKFPFAGFLMLAGGTLLVKTDDNSYQALKCTSQVSSDEALSVFTNTLEVKNLSIGGLALEVVWIQAGKQKKTDWLMISCTDSVGDWMQKGRAGLVLTAGSKVLLKRDLEYRFSDGSDQSNEKPWVLISCP